jgi:hypothetical protein
MQITLNTLPEDLTPEEAGVGYAEGFADAVHDVEDKAEGDWGWCTVELTVTTSKGSATTYLGECSYESAIDFIQTSGYFADMVKDALAEIEQ